MRAAFVGNTKEPAAGRTNLAPPIPALTSRVLSSLDQCISIASDLSQTQAAMIDRIFGEARSDGPADRTEPTEDFASLIMHRLSVLRDLLTDANTEAVRLSEKL
ncbi:MAG TPA: hypothetical protein VIO94_15815 [Phenylobacterium sp.]